MEQQNIMSHEMLDLTLWDSNSLNTEFIHFSYRKNLYILISFQLEKNCLLAKVVLSQKDNQTAMHSKPNNCH